MISVDDAIVINVGNLVWVWEVICAHFLFFRLDLLRVYSFYEIDRPWSIVDIQCEKTDLSSILRDRIKSTDTAETGRRNVTLHSTLAFDAIHHLEGAQRSVSQIFVKILCQLLKQSLIKQELKAQCSVQQVMISLQGMA